MNYYYFINVEILHNKNN